jgi:hypothetical protein
MNSNSSIFKNNKINNRTVNVPATKFKYQTFLIIFLSIILFLIIVYIIVSLIMYYLKKCEQKKTVFQYLFNLSDRKICLIKEEEDYNLDEPNPSLIEKIPLFEKNEVFHLANQDYTYEQSKCKCASYGARLAKKDELINAFNHGANWCTYGWTDGQSAFYPVQKCDWDTLQRENQKLPDKVKKYCGTPGLNGGFFPNPELKFGVNCYGKKPKGNIIKEAKCDSVNFCKLESNYKAATMLDSDEISAFNKEKWNQPIL